MPRLRSYLTFNISCIKNGVVVFKSRQLRVQVRPEEVGEPQVTRFSVFPTCFREGIRRRASGPMPMYCQNCGKELTPGAAYCANCGAKVGAYAPEDWRWERRRERWERRRERWERHEWEPVDAAFGAIRGVGFLIVIGLTIFMYPDVFTLVIRYLSSWGVYGHPVLPPYALGQPIVFLFSAAGVWGLVSAGLRLAFTSRLARSFREVVGAMFSLYIAFIFTEFYGRAVRGAGLVLLFFLGLAAVVLVNTLIWHYIPRRKTQKQAPPS